MLKFFRQIRQQLLRENQTSKYLLYAGGEILLVMRRRKISLHKWAIEDSRKVLSFVKEELKHLE